MYRYAHDMLPPSFENLFTKLHNFERSLSFKTIFLKKANLKLLPSYAMVDLWNGLPLTLKRKNSVNIFKSDYKRTLMESYNIQYNTPDCFSCRTT